MKYGGSAVNMAGSCWLAGLWAGRRVWRAAPLSRGRAGKTVSTQRQHRGNCQSLFTAIKTGSQRENSLWRGLLKGAHRAVRVRHLGARVNWASHCVKLSCITRCHRRHRGGGGGQARYLKGKSWNLKNKFKKIFLKKYIYPRNRPWKPIGLLDFKDPTLYRYSAHRRR
jgi:hypothetical protein